jgi:hypothetical protein
MKQTPPPSGRIPTPTAAATPEERNFFTALGAIGGKPGEPPPPLTANAAVYIQNKPMATEKAGQISKATGNKKVFTEIQYKLSKNYAPEVMHAMEAARGPAADPVTTRRADAMVEPLPASRQAAAKSKWDAHVTTAPKPSGHA